MSRLAACVRSGSASSPRVSPRPLRNGAQLFRSHVPSSSVGAGYFGSHSRAARSGLSSRARVPQQRVAVRSQQQSAEGQSQSLGRDIFDREEELAKLNRMNARAPVRVVLVVGPRSCGKTAVFQKFARDRDSVVMIDMRMVPGATPAAFVSTFVEQLACAVPPAVTKSFPLVVQEMLPKAPASQLSLAIKAVFAAGAASKVTGKDVAGDKGWSADYAFDASKFLEAVNSALTSVAAKGGSGGGTAANDLNPLYEAAGLLLASWEKARREAPADQPLLWPMLIVDEANVLAEWQDEYPGQLAALLRFFVAISKQSQRCHVLLATSEWGFRGWLEQRIGAQFVRAEAIGNFPEEEARAFFMQRLQVDVQVDDDTWRAVYRVCGGNAGDLDLAAEEITDAVLEAEEQAGEVPGNQLDWNSVLQKVAATAWAHTKAMARPQQSLGWTATQYAAVALALLEAPSNIILLGDALLLLGRLELGPGASPYKQSPAGAQVLDRMVQANALAVHSASSWARDIPASVAPVGELVVVAPSAVSLHCMRQLEQEFRSCLEQEGRGHATVQAEPREVDIEAIAEEALGSTATVKNLKAWINAHQDELEPPAAWQQWRRVRLVHFVAVSWQQMTCRRMEAEGKSD